MFFSFSIGDLELVKKVVLDHPHIVNCRDLDGRHSTPLHFAAGYNRVGVVEFLLQHGNFLFTKAHLFLLQLVRLQVRKHKSNLFLTFQRSNNHCLSLCMLQKSKIED